MFGNKLINTNAGGGCTNTVDLYNPFPDGGGVALYQLNGNANDVSGNYDGTATNVTYGAGQFGQAGVFNGSSSKIVIPSTVSASTDATDFNRSLWLSTNTAFTGIGGVIGADGSNSPVDFYISNVSGNTYNLTFIRRYGGTYYGFANTSNFELLPTTFYHLSLNYRHSPKSIDLYINGSLVSTTTTIAFTGSQSAVEYECIGQYNSDPIYASSAWDGKIDQVRIFNRALRPYEVEALYTEEYCTPTIVPSEHFNTVTYTGDGSANHAITGVGFAPDFTWIKNRDTTTFHALVNSVVGENYIQYSNSTSAGETNANIVTSLDSDGFTVGIETTSNGSGQGLVAWNFKAGGAAVTNTDGNTTSQISANPDAGFSIVTHTSSMQSSQTFGHGLNTTPKIVISRVRNIADSWWVFMPDVIGSTNVLELNATAAARSVGLTFNANDTTFNIQWTSTSYDFLHYCFAEVEGFSNFGSYTGTGANTNTIVTGFEPAFLLVKQTNTARNWYVMDNKRNPENPKSKLLFPNDAGAEYTGSGDTFVDFLENGFEITPLAGDAINQSGGSYIYMAFAADPTAVEPTLEDSFNTVLYTGNGGTQSVTGVGFQPDLVWVKNRQSPPINSYNLLFDSVRGATKWLSSNFTGAEGTIASSLTSFDSDGFSLGTDPVGGSEGWNINGNEHVAWNWKGAELPAINSNGSIPSVVSANPAAGFSIVSYTGNGTAGATFGHGLNQAPELIIPKNRDAAQSWVVGADAIGKSYILDLSNPNAKLSRAGQYYYDWDSTTITTGSQIHTNGLNDKIIAYCFHSVAGFSKFGSYTGTGAAGNTVTLGFEPAFVMFKNTSSTGQWWIHDNKRGDDKRLFAESSAAESTNGALTTNATGFSFNDANSNLNSSGATYIYMAFANQF